MEVVSEPGVSTPMAGTAPAEIEFKLVDGKLSPETRDAIKQKAKELAKENGVKRVFPVVVYGDETDEKPVYVAYFKRPDNATYSRFMSLVQDDQVKASTILAQSTIVGGDVELVNDSELFNFGTMNQLTPIVQSRGGEVVKL